jgi:hypothetical protein
MDGLAKQLRERAKKERERGGLQHYGAEPA